MWSLGGATPEDCNALLHQGITFLVTPSRRADPRLRGASIGEDILRTCRAAEPRGDRRSVRGRISASQHSSQTEVQAQSDTQRRSPRRTTPHSGNAGATRWELTQPRRFMTECHRSSGAKRSGFALHSADKLPGRVERIPST